MSITAQIKEIKQFINDNKRQFLLDINSIDYEYFELELFINLGRDAVEIYPFGIPYVKCIDLCDFEMWMNDVKAGIDRHDLMIIWNRHLETLAGL